MSIKSICIVCISFILSNGMLLGQKEYQKKADMYFESNNFAKAVKYYSRMQDVEKKSKSLLRKAISHFNLNELNAARNDFMTLAQARKEKERVDYYLGRIAHHDLEFEKAVRYYKSYLRHADKNDAMRPMIRNLISQCGTGIRVLYREPSGFVENFGPEVNSREEEFGAIQSPIYNDVFYFTSNRKGSAGGLRDEKGIKDKVIGRYYYDMYKVVRNKNQWFGIEPLDPIMNSYRHDVLLDFSDDGSSMLYYQSKDNEELTIFYDEFSENRTVWKLSEEFESSIYGDIGDRYVQLFNSQTIIFSSKRPGGYGGYDLYVTSYINNKWSEPRNLGANVNTPSDEISPFLVRNGKRLYFSSNSSNSIGGHDVFYSDFLLNSKKWGAPINLGIPINSAEDDTYFRIMNDAVTATFTSNRKECIGGMDLYFAYLKNPEENHQKITTQDSYVTRQSEKEEQDKVKEVVVSSDETEVKTTPRSRPLPESKKEIAQEDKYVAQGKNTDTEIKKSIPEEKVHKRNVSPYENKKKESKKQEIASYQPPKDYTRPKKKKKEEKSKRVEVEKFTIKPMFYDEADQILTVANTQKLDEVVRLMNFYKGSTVEFNCNTGEEGATPYELFFSIERAEHAALYLDFKGIDKSRIAIKGLGNNYPLVKSDESNSSKTDLNKRIDIVVQNISELTTPIFVEEPKTTNHSQKYTDYMERIKGISYKVQIVKTDKMFKNQVLRFYDDPLVEKDILTGQYMYSIGLMKKYAQAMELKNSLTNGGWEDTEIIPYFNGKRIENGKLKSYSEVFPDLKNLITYAN